MNKIPYQNISQLLPQNLNDLSAYVTEIDYKYKNVSDWAGAVCLLFIEDCLIFIQRSDSMPSHKGQIAFFGGHRKQSELEPEMTANRELVEETGIQINYFQFLGLLPPVYTSNKNIVIPAIYTTELNLSSFWKQLQKCEEWSHCFAVKLPVFQDFTRWSYGVRQTAQDEYPIYFFNIRENEYVSYFIMNFKENLLWGASAQILWNFLSICNTLLKK
jgi:8-oxo-dGTP pyrophosphatase MutT (NUDIX family)